MSLPPPPSQVFRTMAAQSEYMAWLGGKRQRDASSTNEEDEPQVRRARSQEEREPRPRVNVARSLHPETPSSSSWPLNDEGSLDRKVKSMMQKNMMSAFTETLPIAPRLSDYCAEGGTERYLPRPEWLRFRPSFVGRKRQRELESSTDEPVPPPAQMEPPPVAQQGYVEAPADGLLPNDAFSEFQLPQPPPPPPPPPATLDAAPSHELVSQEQAEPRLATFGRDFDSALHVALRENATKAALGLMNAGASVHAENSKAVTPLILASQKGNLIIVEELWKRGACVLQESVSGCTPLIQAAHFGHLDIVEFLLLKGASMEVGNHNDTTPLMRAAQEGHYHIVEVLLKKGAEVNRRNNEQMSALMLASQRGHMSIVEQLVDAGAQVDAMTTQNSTSLMLACKRGHVNVVRELVTAGCELLIRDSRGRTAKDMAVRKNLSELCKLLDPDVQVDLIRRRSRSHRNFAMVQMWTLLQQERARVPLMGSNVSIHNVTEELLVNTGSFSALVRTMTLPAPLLEHIASFMPLPRLWDRRTALILKQCTVDPDAAIAASLELIDEALVEGGFVEACDEANVTPPPNFSSWHEWKAWGFRFKGVATAPSVTQLAMRPNVTEATLPGLPRFGESSPASAASAADRPIASSLEMRRGICFLQLLAHRSPMLARILSMPPYNMPPLLIQQLITVSDIQSLSRRMGSNGVHFEATVAIEMLMLSSNVCLWYGRERDSI